MGIKIQTTTKQLKELLAPIACIADECRIHIEPNKINSKIVDNRNISMITIDYPADMFNSYEVQEATLIGLELKVLLNKIKYNTPKDIIDISSKSVENAIGIESTLFLECDGFNDKISLIDCASIRKEPIIPTLDLTGKCTLQTKRLLKILNKSQGNEYISFQIKDEQFITESEYYAHKTTSITSPDTITGEGRGLYSYPDLLKITKVIKSKTIDIEMGTDYPIKLKFDVANKGKAEFLLAPRVESE